MLLLLEIDMEEVELDLEEVADNIDNLLNVGDSLSAGETNLILKNLDVMEVVKSLPSLIKLLNGLYDAAVVEVGAERLESLTREREANAKAAAAVREADVEVARAALTRARELTS